jgi:deazaflavin-dependent oxidoreductase (nitroreductase family)
MSTFYNKPSGLTKFFNSIFGWLGRRGWGPKKLVEIEVRGRKSGEPRRAAVNVLEMDRQRYLVSPRGDTEWSRNARVAGEAVIHRGKQEHVRLVELPEGERAPIIQAYLKENAMVTKREFGIEPDAPIEEFQAIAGKHPVFRIEPVTSTERTDPAA